MLEKYPFVRELGGGGFGWVFLARHAESGQEVAVKLLRAGDNDQRERFARELRILREQVNNRYVVSVLDADLDHVPPYIVLEYCDGGSLRDWVTSRKDWAVVATALLHATLGLRVEVDGEGEVLDSGAPVDLEELELPLAGDVE